ncbi:MAG: archease [Pseudonocardia sp.]|nr:archease [Pseudonocardia sp.]
MTGRPGSDRGHRFAPHTADIRIEAWAPTREACLAEAVTALVASFADVTGAVPESLVTARIASDCDTDLLVSVLDEVIYLLDTRAAVPVGADFVPDPEGLGVRFHLIPVDRVPLVGPVPKAVTLQQPRLGRRPDGWSCSVTIDV